MSYKLRKFDKKNSRFLSHVLSWYYYVTVLCYVTHFKSGIINFQFNKQFR